LSNWLKRYIVPIVLSGVSAASEEQTASMIENENASQGLSTLANELQQAINKFE